MRFNRNDTLTVSEQSFSSTTAKTENSSDICVRTQNPSITGTFSTGFSLGLNQGPGGSTHKSVDILSAKHTLAEWILFPLL